MAMRGIRSLLGLLLVSLVAAAPLVATAQPLQNRSQVSSTATSTTDGNIVVFSGTSGKKVKDGGSISSIGGVPSSRTVSTTSPLGGGGALSSNLTLTCTTCVTTARLVSTTTPLGGGGALSGDLTLTCTTCIRGALGATDNVLMRSDGTGGVTAQGSGITLDDSDRLGFGTAVPTASITLASTATGIRAYNTVDQITNPEYLEFGLASNIGVVRTVKAGSGTQRALLLDTNTNNLSISGATGGLFTFTGALSNQAFLAVGSAGTGWVARGNLTTGTTPVFQVTNNASLTSSSTVQVGSEVALTANQTSTAGYKAHRVVVTETGTGSGQKDLQSLETAAGVKARVDNVGTPVFAAGTAPPASGSVVACIKLSSTSNLGFCVGDGAPTFSAAKGTFYSNTTATTTTTRLYVNTDGGTTWTNLTTGS